MTPTPLQEFQAPGIKTPPFVQALENRRQGIEKHGCPLSQLGSGGRTAAKTSGFLSWPVRSTVKARCFWAAVRLRLPRHDVPLPRNPIFSPEIHFRCQGIQNLALGIRKNCQEIEKLNTPPQNKRSLLPKNACFLETGAPVDVGRLGVRSSPADVRKGAKPAAALLPAGPVHRPSFPAFLPSTFKPLIGSAGTTQKKRDAARQGGRDEESHRLRATSHAIYTAHHARTQDPKRKFSTNLGASDGQGAGTRRSAVVHAREAAAQQEDEPEDKQQSQ